MWRRDLGNFRPPEALARPRERQTTTQGEKPAPGKWSGPPGPTHQTKCSSWILWESTSHRTPQD
eukprot:5763174-Pyramimonas_sp.AAC.1